MHQYQLFSGKRIVLLDAVLLILLSQNEKRYQRFRNHCKIMSRIV